MRTCCDPQVIKQLLRTPATWAVVGLSGNTKRTGYSIRQYVRDRTVESLGLLYAMHWPYRQVETARGVSPATLIDPA